MTSFIPNVRRAQKESLFFREISQLFMQAALDDPRLNDVMIHRVQLSPDKGVCTVYFYTNQGEEHFKNILNVLVLYRPSLRKALASKIRSRYTPELIFRFDTQFEKQLRIDQLLEEQKTRDEPS
ncbi:ribosome-binding factor A [Candidatus Dependentiae bacterium]|nr:ribosome-binding factor A [Candidatus Dependentiae bacterium]